MPKSQKLMTQFYQYISEGILVYFLLFPIIQISELTVNFLLYALIILFSFLCFKVASLGNVTFAPFILATPVVAIVAIFLFDFPIPIAVIMSVILVWRFLAHEHEPNKENQPIILLSSILIVFVEVLLSYENILIFVLILQCSVMLFGHLMAHYYQVPQDERKKGTRNLINGLVLFIVGTIMVILALSPIRWLVEKAWFLASGLFLQGVKGLLFTLESVGVDVSNIKALKEKPILELNGQMKEENNESSKKLIQEENRVDEVSQVIEWGSLLLIVLTIIIVIFVMSRKRRQPAEEDRTAQHVYYSSLSSETLQKKESRAPTFWRSKRADPVRREFHQFEKFSIKKGYGRRVNESIEEWFKRQNFSVARTDLYQQVRYGHAKLNENERNRFFEEMRELRTDIENRSKGR
ncbi:hypothetical protein [Halobacillus hunanensis]|uniref:hypothetical protein n=1 Tax=Halobacillus hunanensis TaxID=578214 RepID=UPI0009A815F8|nr:hypothetical protein [Halobacillus hunanensis]